MIKKFIKYQSLGNNFVLYDWYDQLEETIQQALQGVHPDPSTPFVRPLVPRSDVIASRGMEPKGRMEGTAVLGTKGVSKGSWPSFVKEICNRNTGVGADGVLILKRNEQEQLPEMLIFNADGTQAESCLNGLRCVTHYLVTKHGFPASFAIKLGKRLVLCEVDENGSFPLSLETSSNDSSSGIRECDQSRDERALNLNQSRDERGQNLNPSPRGVRRSSKSEGGCLEGYSHNILITNNVGSVDYHGTKTVTIFEGSFQGHVASIGNPHFIIFQKIERTWLEKFGASLESHEAFENKTNVEFVWEDAGSLSLETSSNDSSSGIRECEQLGDGREHDFNPSPRGSRSDVSRGMPKYHVLVYERGCGTTQACSSGAAAIVGTLLHLKKIEINQKIELVMLGGSVIGWADQQGKVFLQASAQPIFTGLLII